METIMSTAKNITYANALEEIIEFFGYDKDKALSWYMTPNEQFENLTPYEMIKIGKGQKMMSFLRNIMIEKYSR